MHARAPGRRPIRGGGAWTGTWPFLAVLSFRSRDAFDLVDAPRTRPASSRSRSAPRRTPVGRPRERWHRGSRPATSAPPTRARSRGDRGRRRASDEPAEPATGELVTRQPPLVDSVGRWVRSRRHPRRPQKSGRGLFPGRTARPPPSRRAMLTKTASPAGRSGSGAPKRPSGRIAGEDAPAPAAPSWSMRHRLDTPDRQLKPGVNRFEVRVSESRRHVDRTPAVVKMESPCPDPSRRGCARAPDADRRPPARRPGPRGLPRRAPRPGPAGRALPEHGPGGATADGPGARAAGGPGDDQAARRGRGAPALDVLPHVPGDGDHGVPVERGNPRARHGWGRARLLMSQTVVCDTC